MRSFAPVGYIHIIILVNFCAPGMVELAITAAESAPRGQKLTFLGEHLDPVIQAVHQIEVFIRIEGQPRGTVKFTVTIANRPPLADPLPVFVADGDPVEPLIGHVGVAFFVESDGCGPHEAAIWGGGVSIFRRNFLAELPH